MNAVIYGLGMAAAIVALWFLMTLWARKMWGKAYDKPLAMGEMMAKIGVAPEAMATIGMRGRTVAAARTCAECRNEAVCHDYLDGKNDAKPAAFCPNNQLFESLKR